MMTHGSNANPSAKIQALRSKHAAIEEKLSEALKSPSSADYYLAQLKKQKLILKDEIEIMQRSAAN